MQKTSEIPSTITTAITSILAPYCPGLTPSELTKRLSFVPGAEEQAERLLTRKESAAALAISTITLDRMIKAGELEARRIRGSVRIPHSAVQAIIEG